MSRAFIPPNARRSQTRTNTLFSSNPPSLPTAFQLDIVATDPVCPPLGILSANQDSIPPQPTRIVLHVHAIPSPSPILQTVSSLLPNLDEQVRPEMQRYTT